VDCQANPAQARIINVEATALLAAWRRRRILFSSRRTLCSTVGREITSKPMPSIRLSVYAETKVAAESILARNSRHLVVRTSLNSGASPSGKERLQRATRCRLEGRKNSQTVSRRISFALSAAATARAVWELAASPRGGVWHLAGSERLSRLQIGQLLAERHSELKLVMEAARSASTKERRAPPTAP
jgi:dTDP-4-dehydrorhamnose reductase